MHEIANILFTFSEQFEVYLFSNSITDSVLDNRFHNFEISPLLDTLTKDVDLIFTTASTSSLEFLARGLCVGIACAVDNQEQYYRSLGELGVASQIGYRSKGNVWELDKEVIYSLVTSPELRRKLTAQARGLIDFKGASRIVDAIKAL